MVTLQADHQKQQMLSLNVKQQRRVCLNLHWLRRHQENGNMQEPSKQETHEVAVCVVKQTIDVFGLVAATKTKHQNSKTVTIGYTSGV